MVQHPAFATNHTQPMSKPKKETQEAKKPKKSFVPNAPGLPAGLAPLAYNPLKPKKR